jgi:hypothetical protein
MTARGETLIYDNNQNMCWLSVCRRAYLSSIASHKLYLVIFITIQIMPPNAPEARVLTKDFAAVSIAHNIANDGDSTATKLGSSILEIYYIRMNPNH